MDGPEGGSARCANVIKRLTDCGVGVGKSAVLWVKVGGARGGSGRGDGGRGADDGALVLS